MGALLLPGLKFVGPWMLKGAGALCSIFLGKSAVFPVINFMLDPMNTLASTTLSLVTLSGLSTIGFLIGCYACYKITKNCDDPIGATIIGLGALTLGSMGGFYAGLAAVPVVSSYVFGA